MIADEPLSIAGLAAWDQPERGAITVRDRIAGNSARMIMLGLLAVALGLTGPAAAREMTLPDCISAALEANRDIAAARENLAQAASGVAEARSGFMPNLSLSASYNFAEKVPTMDLPLGGHLQQIKLDITKDYSLGVALAQPLYTGGRLSSSYRMSEASRDIAGANLEREQADAALSVIGTFYALLLARESVGVAEQAVKTAQEFLRVVQARRSAGQASDFEVMRAEVEVANLEPALINAKNAVALAELTLKRELGIKAEEDVTFVGSFDESTVEVDAADAVRQGLDRRPEVRMAKAKARIAHEGLGLAKAGRLPTLAATANYAWGADKLKLEGDTWETTYNGYLVLSLPIFDGLKTKSQISRSRSEARQAEIELANLESGVELEVRSSVLNLAAAVAALKSQEQNVGVAEQGLKIANDRYLQGLATNLDVMDAQLALTRARNYRLQALHDLNLATAALKRATGSLLDGFAGAR